MRWISKVSVMIVPLTQMVGCGKAEKSKPMVIIGNDDQRPVEDDPQGQKLGELTQAIGLTNYKCTAFHLGEGLVATAGHCFPKAKSPSKRRPCLETSITWGHTDKGSASMVSRCVEVLSRQEDDKADFAFIRVDPVPQVAFEMELHPDLNNSHWVAGHPKGEPLRISGSCELRPRGDQQVEHHCDTLPGNSGSPIINEELRVVGIHDGGHGQVNYGTLLGQTHILDYRDQMESIPSVAEAYRFGPMANNQSELLLSVTSDMGESASLELDLDIEASYDQVKYVDRNGEIKSLTGKTKVVLENLPTPVLVSFVSDYAGESHSIDIKNLETY